MSSFPPPSWNVRFLQDMESLECSLTGENNITMEAFVAVRPAGGQEGNFKFVIGGPRMLKLSFPVSKLLGDPVFNNMTAEIEMKPGEQIKLCKNSACSAWWDFEVPVFMQTIRSMVFGSLSKFDGDGTPPKLC